MQRWKEEFVAYTQRKCVHIHNNGDYEHGKVLYLEPDWTYLDFLNAASTRLESGPVAKRCFNSDGVEINDCMMIEDDDMLFLSTGEDFVPPFDQSIEIDDGDSRKVEGEKLPHSIGGYKTGEVLGRGGFGEVRVGEHHITQEKVALKFLRKSEIHSLGAAERTNLEIQCLMALKHTNIIRLQQHMESQNHVVLVFELMEGGDLLKYLIRRQAVMRSLKANLSEDEARHVFYQVLSAVSYAHNQHICHRDLKLENILLKDTTLAVVKIADFGLSDFYRPGAVMKSSCGTLSFLAPEVFKGTANAGPPLDVWAMGVILFALLCGRLPFEGPDLIGTKRPRDAVIKSRIMKGQFKIDDNLGAEAKDLLQRLLQSDPAERINIPEIFNHAWARTASSSHFVDLFHQFQVNANITSPVTSLSLTSPAVGVSSTAGAGSGGKNTPTVPAFLSNIIDNSHNNANAINATQSPGIKNRKTVASASSSNAANTTLPMIGDAHHHTTGTSSSNNSSSNNSHTSPRLSGISNITNNNSNSNLNTNSNSNANNHAHVSNAAVFSLMEEPVYYDPLKGNLATPPSLSPTSGGASKHMSMFTSNSSNNSSCHSPSHNHHPSRRKSHSKSDSSSHNNTHNDSIINQLEVLALIESPRLSPKGGPKNHTDFDNHPSNHTNSSSTGHNNNNNKSTIKLIPLRRNNSNVASHQNSSSDLLNSNTNNNNNGSGNNSSSHLLFSHDNVNNINNNNSNNSSNSDLPTLSHRLSNGAHHTVGIAQLLNSNNNSNNNNNNNNGGDDNSSVVSTASAPPSQPPRGINRPSTVTTGNRGRNIINSIVKEDEHNTIILPPSSHNAAAATLESPYGSRKHPHTSSAGGRKTTSALSTNTGNTSGSVNNSNSSSISNTGYLASSPMMSGSGKYQRHTTTNATATTTTNTINNTSSNGTHSNNNVFDSNNNHKRSASSSTTANSHTNILNGGSSNAMMPPMLGAIGQQRSQTSMSSSSLAVPSPRLFPAPKDINGNNNNSNNNNNNNNTYHSDNDHHHHHTNNNDDVVIPGLAMNTDSHHPPSAANLHYPIYGNSSSNHLNSSNSNNNKSDANGSSSANSNNAAAARHNGMSKPFSTIAVGTGTGTAMGKTTRFL